MVSPFLWNLGQSLARVRQGRCFLGHFTVVVLAGSKTTARDEPQPATEGSPHVGREVHRWPNFLSGTDDVCKSSPSPQPRHLVMRTSAEDPRLTELSNSGAPDSRQRTEMAFDRILWETV